MAFFSALSAILLSRGTPAFSRKSVSFCQWLSKYEIARPRPELPIVRSPIRAAERTAGPPASSVSAMTIARMTEDLRIA